MNFLILRDSFESSFPRHRLRPVSPNPDPWRDQSWFGRPAIGVSDVFTTILRFATQTQELCGHDPLGQGFLWQYMSTLSTDLIGVRDIIELRARCKRERIVSFPLA
jgi:hypothetical protein